MNDILKWILLGFGGYLLYEKFFAMPTTSVGTTGGATDAAVIAAAQAKLLADTKAGIYGPQGASSLLGPSLDLRNGLVACWLGAQTPPKTWDASANPSLAIADWDNLETSCISPGAKPVGGTQSVNADDYVKLRVAGNLGLSGLGIRPAFVHPRGRNLTPGTPRRRYFPQRNYVRAGTPMIVHAQPVLPRRRA